ncbi:uncharacterized protein N7498_006421 [Penicillium cinerascens]|uniref:Uncharacterized protein n=1 Tax=Penicillium cinerascens TaxID=70096 RepID=A0A9W9MI43_9EURO|nr:uncharacterized protein N7498_006421 [Penicillium cinerascens]KAJ5201758.1 hypothetical protein N7498_006421 [Penicillium cinerascens]
MANRNDAVGLGQRRTKPCAEALGCVAGFCCWLIVMRSRGVWSRGLIMQINPPRVKEYSIVVLTENPDPGFYPCSFAS